MRRLVFPFLAALFAAAGAEAQEWTGDPWVDSAATDDEAAAAARSIVPFTEEQIRQIAAIVLGAQQAAAEAAGPPPEPRLREVHVELGAAALPPEIRTRRNYATALVFLDRTGQPWPVADAVVDQAFLGEGSEGAGASDAVPHLLVLAPVRDHLHGNAVITLDGLDMPVVISLREGGPVADYRVYVRVPLAGPGADPLLLAHPARLAAADPLLGFFLAGAAPPDASPLEMEPARAGEQAWALAGRVYLRSRSPLLSPAPEAVERSAAGDYVYALPDTPFALLADGASGARRVALRPALPEPESGE